MELMIKPSVSTFKKANTIIGLMDAAPGAIGSNNSPMVSKIAKQIKKVKEPVPRFFESPNQIVSYWAEGEYDLVSIYKLLKFEAFFAKATQKKVSQLVKSGFHVHSDDDAILEYFQNRFLMMFLSTGISIDKLIKQTANYLIIGSNSFIIKVRDPNFEYASSYVVDGKELHPIVGLFIPHPTTMKPRFKYETYTINGVKKNKLILDKWIHVNRRGMMVEFEVSDVAHFTLFKEDGMVFGTPEIISVIDDIKTLRKMEEDIQLLIYRDLFPIIHYTIEEPEILDSNNGWTEMDQAKKDMERIIQDGGIATDSRHKINFVGNNGKSLDGKPYLEYFQQRVFTGLGVSKSDLGMSNNGSGGGQNANSMSPGLLDAVRFIQQEITAQFDELILSEMALQSPFGIDAIRHEKKVTLRFTELDIEWKIRKENHEADLFAKGVKTIDEIRNPMGQKDFSEDHLDRTYFGLYEKPQIEANQELTRTGLEIQKNSNSVKLKQKMNSIENGPSRRKATSSGTKSAATADLTKASKSNSNSVKSHRDETNQYFLNVIDKISIKDQLVDILDSLQSKDRKIRQQKITVMINRLYDRVNCDVLNSINDGVKNALFDLGINEEKIHKRIPREFVELLNNSKVNIINMALGDVASSNIVALRIADIYTSEQLKAYNYSYASTCISNKNFYFTTYTNTINSIADTNKKVVTINEHNILKDILSLKRNSKLKVKSL